MFLGGAYQDGEMLPDPGLKLSINLIGSPALTLREFKAYDKEQFILGLGLGISAPVGQYDDEEPINLGFNRWAVKPELGMSKMLGRWIFEGSVAVAFFSDNNEWLGDKTRVREPLGSVQFHVIYRIRPGGFWVALDATHFRGGQSTIDGQTIDDEMNNNRLGFTLAVPVDKHNSLKLYASDGYNSRRGSEFVMAGLAWQFKWGGGL